MEPVDTMEKGHRELGEMIGQVGLRVDQVDGELKAFRQDFDDFRARMEP